VHSGFSSVVASWVTFYVLAGTASAALAGLVFVAMSLHLDLVGESGVSATFTLARRTPSNFILVVVIALIFVVPRQGPEGLGWPLCGIGGVQVILTFVDVREVVRELNRASGWRVVAMRLIPPIALPLAGGAGLTLIGVTLLQGSTSYLYWMVPVIVVILSTAALNAWELMLGLARHRARTAGAAEPPS